jgi:hypothetical protein
MNDERKSPIQDTLWMRALLALHAIRIEEGESDLKFQDVDDMVIELSKMPIDEMKEKLKI